MGNFKVGDRVKVVKELLDNKRVMGKCGTIIRYEPDDPTAWKVLVSFEDFDNGIGPDGINWWVAEEAIELVPEEPKNQFIVIVQRSNGSLRPAAKPYIHSTLEAAETEAERLATVHPNEGTFQVFQRVSGFKGTRTTSVEKV